MKSDRQITASAVTLSGRETLRACVSPAATARQAMDSLFLHRNFTRFALDGRECPPDTPVGDAASVAAWETPGHGGWQNFLLGLVVTVILSAISYFVNKRMLSKKPRYKKNDQETSETNYGWDYDAENAVQEGAPVPVLYGRRLVIPPLASQRIHDVNDTRESFLDCTYAVADGGAGFDDFIGYLPEGDSRYFARIDHTPWENLNRGSVSASSDENWKTFAHAYGEVFTEVPRSSWEAGNFNGGDRYDFLTDNDDAVSEHDFRTGELFLHFSRNISINRVMLYTRVKWGKSAGAWGSFELHGLDGAGEGQTARWTLLARSNGWHYERQGGYTLIYTYFSGSPKDDVKRSHFKLTRTAKCSFKVDKSTGTPRYQSDGGKAPFTEVRVGGVYTTDGSAVGGGTIALATTAGRFDETPTDFQTGVWSGLTVDKSLETEWFQFATTPRAYPDHAALHIDFPYGCYRIDDSTGDTVSSYVTLSAEYREIAADGTEGAWSPFFNASHAGSDVTYDSSGNTVTIGLATQSATSLTFQRDAIGNGAARLELRVRRGDAPADSGREINVCQWKVLEEGWAFVPAYPRTATAVLQMNASEKFNGRLPQFSICAERATVYVFNTVTGLWERQRADNPAWAAYDLIVRPRFDDVAYTSPDQPGALLRENFPHDRMLYGEFAAWADFCDQSDITCAMYYDAQTTVDKGVQHLCDLGRAQIVLKGGRIGAAVDRRADLDPDGNPLPVFVFDDSNIVADSWGCQFRDRADLPTEYEVTFFDRDREWNRFTVIASDPDVDATAAPNSQSVTLYACDRREVAQAFAEYAIGQNRVTRTYSWSGGLDAMPVEIGDLVQVRGALVRVTAVSAEEDFTRKYEGVEYVDARFA